MYNSKKYTTFAAQKQTNNVCLCDKMSTNEWISNRELHGQMTFSIGEMHHVFSDRSPKNMNTELARLVARDRIQSVYRGFYVIVPIQYRLKGIIPPSFYIDELMQHLGKPYYIGLLSAAAMYGAGHQRAMQTQVVTTPPRLNVSNRNQLLDWNYRQNFPQELLITKNAEMGVIHYSSPELTAVDLVQYAEHVGGYQRATTVLAELVDILDMTKVADVIPYTTIATIQRLGYLLEFVLEKKEKADALYLLLKERKHWKSVLLNSSMPSKTASTNRWHVIANIDIEIDEL